MKCEFEHCIFNRRYICILGEITINACGMCEDCIIAPSPGPLLETLKEIQLEDLKNREACDG